MDLKCGTGILLLHEIWIHVLCKYYVLYLDCTDTLNMGFKRKEI